MTGNEGGQDTAAIRRVAVSAEQIPTLAYPYRLAALIAAHNRRETTLRCLESLYCQPSEAFALQTYLVDDGSGDGTSDAVRARFPQVRLLSGNGALFWNGAMRLAWSAAMEERPDLVLWLNDDTFLRPAAVADLVALYRREAENDPRTIVVGRTKSAAGDITYGGYRRAGGFSKLRFRRLSATESDCDTFNGNCVLVPACAVDELGMLSERFRHAFGDNDYGLRARRAGYRIVELKEAVATQEANLRYQKQTQKLSLSNWRFIFFHPKGVPLREWYWFCREHGGTLWPLNFVYRYVKMALS